MKAKGIIMDLGHGQGSFDWDVAEAAVASGIWPDGVSTDLHSGNVGGPVYDLPFVASKLLHLGMSLDDLIKALTATPAKVMNRYPQLGSLSPGSCGDLTLFSVERSPFNSPLLAADSSGAVRRMPKYLKPHFVVREGRLIACKPLVWDPCSNKGQT